MKLYAKNKYLVVELPKEEKTEVNPLSSFMASVEKKRWDLATVLDAHPDSDFYIEIGNRVLFQGHLLETFNIDDQVYHIIPESAVYGVFGE